MNKTGAIILGMILLSMMLVGSRSFDRGKCPATLPETTPIAPRDDYGADLTAFERRQGVGWVFGRMIGVSSAPGNPNHSPFSYNRTWAGGPTTSGPRN